MCPCSIEELETKGSGIRIMRELVPQNNLLPPTFESSRRPDQFVAVLLFHHFLGPDDVAWLRDLTTEPISDEEARALIYVRENGVINNAAYRELNRAETLDASTHLRRLCKLDLLIKEGTGNRTYYEPSRAFHVSLVRHGARQNGQTVPLEPNESRNLEDESRNPSPESRNLSLESRNLGAESRKLPEDLTTEHLPNDLAAKVASLPRRPSQERLRTLIGQLCQWQPLNSKQLSHLLGRQREPLVRDYLKPMIATGRLAYTIPDAINHPDQAYAAPPAEDNGKQP